MTPLIPPKSPTPTSDAPTGNPSLWYPDPLENPRCQSVAGCNWRFHPWPEGKVGMGVEWGKTSAKSFFNPSLNLLLSNKLPARHPGRYAEGETLVLAPTIQGFFGEGRSAFGLGVSHRLVRVTDRWFMGGVSGLDFTVLGGAGRLNLQEQGSSSRAPVTFNGNYSFLGFQALLSSFFLGTYPTWVPA